MDRNPESHGTTWNPDHLSVPCRETEDDRCVRCGGLLFPCYQDIHADTGRIDFCALRCTICGEVLDQGMYKNRRTPSPNLFYGTIRRECGQRVVSIQSMHERPSNVSDDEHDVGTEKE